jgi:hypothetical protein
MGLVYLLGGYACFHCQKEKTSTEIAPPGQPQSRQRSLFCVKNHPQLGGGLESTGTQRALCGESEGQGKWLGLQTGCDSCSVCAPMLEKGFDILRKKPKLCWAASSPAPFPPCKALWWISASASHDWLSRREGRGRGERERERARELFVLLPSMSTHL